jgi:hypothetical protein
MGLHARGDGYCETANEPRDPRAFCLRENDDLDVTKVKATGGDGGDARQGEETRVMFDV